MHIREKIWTKKPCDHNLRTGIVLFTSRVLSWKEGLSGYGHCCSHPSAALLRRTSSSSYSSSTTSTTTGIDAEWRGRKREAQGEWSAATPFSACALEEFDERQKTNIWKPHYGQVAVRIVNNYLRSSRAVEWPMDSLASLGASPLFSSTPHTHTHTHTPSPLSLLVSLFLSFSHSSGLRRLTFFLSFFLFPFSPPLFAVHERF